MESIGCHILSGFFFPRRKCHLLSLYWTVNARHFQLKADFITNTKI